MRVFAHEYAVSFYAPIKTQKNDNPELKSYIFGGVREGGGVNLCRVNFSLYDVEDGNVAMVFEAVNRCRHHHVLRLKQTSHDVQHSCLSDTGNLKEQQTPYLFPDWNRDYLHNHVIVRL